MADDQSFVRSGLIFDGLPPNKQGGAIMKLLVKAAIRKALKSKKQVYVLYLAVIFDKITQKIKIVLEDFESIK